MKIVKSMTMFIVVLMVVASLPLGAFAAVVPYSDTTDIMDDLATLSIDGVAFNEEDYPLKDGGESEILGVYEYGRGTDSHALYIYVYHPEAQAQDTVYNYSTYMGSVWCWCETLSGANYHFDTDHGLEFVLLDHSDDYRFLKLKVDLSSLCAGTRIPSSSVCIYSVGVVFWGTYTSPYAGPDGYLTTELIEIDAGSYSQRYYFDTKRALYYSGGADLTLNVNHSIYYTETSPKGKNYRQALYTAYFSVPEVLFGDEYYLTSLRCKWEEAHTTPQVVTDDADMYSHLAALANYSGVLDGSNVDYGAVLVCPYYYNYIGLLGGLFYDLEFNSSINAPKTYQAFNNAYISNDFCTLVKYPDLIRNNDVFDNAFLVENLDDFYLETQGDLYLSGYLRASSQRVTLTGLVDEGCLAGSNTYEISSNDLLDVDGRYNDSCWFHGFLSFMFGDDEDITVRQLITIPDPSDVEGLSNEYIINNYYIGEHYVDDFKRACSNAAEAGERMVLLRYAVRDYYSAPALYVSPDDYALKLKNWFVSNVIVTPSNCIVMGYTYFDDFTVIDLTFSSESVSYSIDVKCEPTDVLPGGMPPSDPDSLIYDIINIGSSVGEGISDAMRVVRIVIKVVLAVVITLVAIKLITALVKLLKAIFHRRT